MGHRIRSAVRDAGRLSFMCLIGLTAYVAAPWLLGCSGRRPS